jgi:protein-disulfide isomerase
MKRLQWGRVGVISFLLLLASCTTEKQLKEQLRKIIKEDPSLIIEAVESKPLAFMEALQKAARMAQSEMAKQQEEEDKKSLESSFTNPLVPQIRSDESFRGDKNAPLILVEYSDFECPFCSRGYETVTQLREKYGKNIAFVYKHLPLSFHKQAMVASQYYEAIRLQSPQKAWEFHDEIFKNQGKLKNGEAFLKSIAEKLKVNMSKLSKDIESEAVKNRIEEDIKEAGKFGFQGTPGFLLNGIPVKGAYPPAHFDSIVEELKKRGKVTL